MPIKRLQALGDITNAVLKKEPEKAAAVRRPINRKTSNTDITKPMESKPLLSKQTNVDSNTSYYHSEQIIPLLLRFQP